MASAARKGHPATSYRDKKLAVERVAAYARAGHGVVRRHVRAHAQRAQHRFQQSGAPPELVRNKVDWFVKTRKRACLR